MAHHEQDHIDGWITYSNWIDDLRDNSQVISEHDNDTKFKQQFLACQCNKERFQFIWNNDNIRNEIENAFKSDNESCERIRNLRTTKSAEESKRMRELGNKSFKECKFKEALNYYTQAVRYALYPNNEVEDHSLALALANRSAALYALTRYRLCLVDIDSSIKYGYPKANMFKLLIRKVRCLHILSVWANDVEQIKADLKSMLKKSDVKEYVKVEISSLFEFLETTQPEEMEKDELDAVDETTMKISNTSKTLSQAADCVEMSYDSSIGRYLLTNKDISYGRLLLAEEPYVCILAPDKRDDYCYNCFARLHSCGIGCQDCTQVLYCSELCRTAKSELHAFECNSFLEFQDKIGVAYIVAQILFKIKFELNSVPVYTKKTVERKSYEEILQISPSDWPDLVYKNDYASVLSLMDHSDDYGYDELIGFTLTAAYMMFGFLEYQRTISNNYINDKSYHGALGSIILLHLMQLQTNLISILDQDFQNLTYVGNSLSNIQERPIGVGIYPTISLLNHSCSPNIISIFHRNKFIARAARSLECGTEINYCYGPSVTRMSKKDRQARLKDQYFFDCDCESCKKGEENECRALLCPKCSGPIIYNQDMTYICTKCHDENNIDIRSRIKAIADIQTELGRSQSLESSPQLKLSNLVNLEKRLQGLAYWRHPLFIQLKSELIDCADNLEDVDLALKYCNEELDLCSRTFGADSYETVMTKLKFINYDWQSTYYRIEALPTIERKRESLDLLDKLLLTVNETKIKLKDLLASTNIIGAESSFETELKFLCDIQNTINIYKAGIEPQADSNLTSEASTT